jgi:hypothetical protein
MSETTTRCKRCILPSSYPGIHFDEQGICSYCRMPVEEGRPSEKDLKVKLDKIIGAYRGKGKYDIVVGLSGGKDSSYVAYYLRTEYDLKILGVNFDNGYRSEIAVRNMETLVDKLRIDLITIRPNQTFMKKLYAHFLRKQGEFCSVCNNMGYLLIGSFIFGQKLSAGFAPLGVGGWSKKYEYQPGVSVTSMPYFFKNLSPELLAELIAQPFIEEKVVRSYMRLNDPRQAQIDTKEHKESDEYTMGFIQLPDYVNWDLMKMPQILKKAVGWRQPPNTHDSHFDCTLFPTKEYLKFKRYGLTQETIKNSVLIREGLLTREEALDRMSLEQTEESDDYNLFLKELGLSREDVNEEAEWSR